jgi:hypothetical protein
MAASAHCQTIDRRTAAGDFHGLHMICPAGKCWRVYEDGTGYSQTTGITFQRGKVMRSTSDKPISFPTMDAARAWIDGGCKLLDARHREVFP